MTTTTNQDHESVANRLEELHQKVAEHMKAKRTHTGDIVKIEEEVVDIVYSLRGTAADPIRFQPETEREGHLVMLFKYVNQAMRAKEFGTMTLVQQIKKDDDIRELADILTEVAA